MKKLTIEYATGVSIDTKVYDAQVDDERLYISGRAHEGISEIYSLALGVITRVTLEGEDLYVKEGA